MKFWSESKGYLAWLWVLIPILAFALLYKWQFVSKDALLNNKELIGVASTLVTSAIFLIASVVSYFKFFKGRLLKPKITIEAHHGAIELLSDTLHWIDIGIANKGAVAVWHYNVDMKVNYHSEDIPVAATVTFHSHKQSTPGKEHVIDPGETAYEHATVRVPKGVDVVTYRILVTASSGSVWDRCVTVSNRID